MEINDDSRGTFNTNSLNTFKNLMLKSSLWDYRDGHILVKGTISVPAVAAGEVYNNKEVILKTVLHLVVAKGK